MMRKSGMRGEWRLTAGLAMLTIAAPAGAQAQNAELAKQLTNPVASLVSVPFQLNYDHNIGLAGEGERYTLNIQPVIPFSLSQDWSLISRTILPLISQNDALLPFDPEDQRSLGDTTQSFFLSPKHPGPGGLVWGVGPVFLLPTASDSRIGAETWGAGPTAVILKQQSGWTVGTLANHVWSADDTSDGAEISSTFVQPFITYTTEDAWTFAVNSESTYDWESDQWSVPINFQISKLTHLGSQPISLQGGLRYWAESPETGPEGWGARASLTFLFPEQ